MNTDERVLRLEALALNQTLIIEQLTLLVADFAPTKSIELALDVSAEGILELTFEQRVPLDVLEMAVDWRRGLAGTREIMQIS